MSQISPSVKLSASGEFDRFWEAYPRKEAKLNAVRAYVKARKLASAEDILSGLERYKQTMPAERQYRPLPASWLNAGRWMDEPPDTFMKPSLDDDWFTECERLHGGNCGGSLKHRHRMLLA